MHAMYFAHIQPHSPYLLPLSFHFQIAYAFSSEVYFRSDNKKRGMGKK